MNSDSAVDQLSSEIRGSTRPRVNISEVRNLKFKLPSLSDQKKVNEKIEKFESLTSQQLDAYRIKINSLVELKKSILEKAFKGELTESV